MDQAQMLAVLEANNTHMASQNLMIEKLEAKLTNRPHNGGVSLETAERSTRSGIVYDSDECKAFSPYLRHGRITTEMKAFDITTPADGGFAVPRQISAAIESILLKYSAMRKIVTTEQATTSDFHHLISDTRTMASAWVGEQTARTATATPTFYDIAPPMGDLYANPQATQQMLDDAFFNVEQYIVDAVTETFTSAEGNAFLNGSGVNQPKGLLTYPTLATGDDVRAVNTIQYVPSGAAAGFLATTAAVSAFDCMQAAYFSMNPRYRTDAAWLANSATIAQLAGVRDTTGRYMLTPPTQGFPATILGLPVYEEPFMPVIAANAFPIALVSKRSYLIVDRVPIRLIRDNLTNKPFCGFYTVKRLGGGLLNSNAVKLIKMAVS